VRSKLVAENGNRDFVIFVGVVSSVGWTNTYVGFMWELAISSLKFAYTRYFYKNTYLPHRAHGAYTTA
jgi:hypothetical protein